MSVPQINKDAIVRTFELFIRCTIYGVVKYLFRKQLSLFRFQFA
jgi:hypothetical protein